MDSSHDLNVSMGENETAQIPSRNSRDDGLDHSLDRQSRLSSPERDIQNQISSLATDVKNTVMSLSDTMQIRFERFNEKLSDMQSQISNLEIEIQTTKQGELQFSHFHHQIRLGVRVNQLS